jgi:hypothetical protein
MERLIKIAGDLLDFCETQSWRACVIGGLAVQRWGEPRLTRDVHLSLLTGFGQEAVLIEKLIERYEARIRCARYASNAKRRTTNSEPLDCKPPCPLRTPCDDFLRVLRSGSQVMGLSCEQ